MTKLQRLKIQVLKDKNRKLFRENVKLRKKLKYPKGRLSWKIGFEFCRSNCIRLLNKFKIPEKNIDDDVYNTTIDGIKQAIEDMKYERTRNYYWIKKKKNRI